MGPQSDVVDVHAGRRDRDPTRRRPIGLELVADRLGGVECPADAGDELVEICEQQVWEATAKTMHWRENAVGAMMRVLAGGCTPEHLAAVTGFDVETVKRLLHRPRQEFNGRHPTDRHAPGQERFFR